MITRQQVREAIVFLKSLEGAEHTGFVMDEFVDNFSEVSTFINGGHYKIIDRTERGRLNYYVVIAFKALLDEYGLARSIDTTSLNRTKDLFLAAVDLNVRLTSEPVLEEYLKQLIHGDVFVRVKSVRQLQATVCTFIELYRKNIV